MSCHRVESAAPNFIFRPVKVSLGFFPQGQFPLFHLTNPQFVAGVQTQTVLTVPLTTQFPTHVTLEQLMQNLRAQSSSAASEASGSSNSMHVQHSPGKSQQQQAAGSSSPGIFASGHHHHSLLNQQLLGNRGSAGVSPQLVGPHQPPSHQFHAAFPSHHHHQSQDSSMPYSYMGRPMSQHSSAADSPPLRTRESRDDGFKMKSRSYGHRTVANRSLNGHNEDTGLGRQSTSARSSPHSPTISVNR